MSRRGALALFFVSLLPASCAVESRPDDVVASRAPVRSGTATTGDPAVVGIYLENVILCTGTLVTPKVVVTAGHCLVPQELGGHAITELEVRVGPNVFFPQQKLAVAEGLPHPSFTLGTMNLDGNHDVGLLRLTAPSTVVPATLVTPAAAAQLAAGAPLRVLGYGVTGPGLMDYGPKREAHATVGTLAPDWLALAPAVMCGGDSGGPYLATLGGVEYLVGTHSHGDCDTVSEGSRLDPVLADFITPFVAKDCVADGACDESCVGAGAIDPDCACASDGTCNPDCPAEVGDPDCRCVADGRCDAGCESGGDPDCGAAHEPSATTGQGCAVGAAGTEDETRAAGALGVVLAMAWIRRVRVRRRFGAVPRPCHSCGVVTCEASWPARSCEPAS